ncbi:hypothetical protein [Sphingomonas profundi]|uniref:hypothetical protein n=1 Tax=Alterirhizorhabdus profundi TaxID=2681549 RepID=UPI0012E82FC9|nr:hypothetical protein [Sphingomonas profundi]
MRFSAAVTAVLLSPALLGNAWTGADRTEQARSNYEELMNGHKQLHQLTPQEQADVLALDNALHPRDTRTRSQRCVDEEFKRVGGSPSNLERRVIDMKCREPWD